MVYLSHLQSLSSLESLVAVGTDVPALVLVDQQMFPQRAATVEDAPAYVALVGRVFVSVHVSLQVGVRFETVARE